MSVNFAPNETLREPTLLERYSSRARALRDLVGVFGLKDSVVIVNDRLTGGGRARDRERAVSSQHSGLRHDFMLTYAWPDFATFREVVAHDEYRLPPSLDYIVNGQVIVDIGANIGTSAAYFATHHPKSPIVAIEPHPRNADLLRRNSTPYGGQILVLERALSKDTREVPLANPESEIQGHHNSYLFSHDPAETAVQRTVPSITPSEILVVADYPQRIGLLKIDIEGAEKEIFASSAIDPLLQRTEVLAIETHDRHVPGCADAVMQAIERNKLQRFRQSGHVSFFNRR